MRWLMITGALMGCAGCAAPPAPPPQDYDVFGASLRQRQVDAVDRAIVRQHTLYPYHFIPESATLTSIGERDVGVLSRHLRAYGGPLHVVRGSATSELYQARLQSVTAALVHAGLEAHMVHITDGLPGGDGMRARDAAGLLDEESELSGATNQTTTQTNQPTAFDAGG